MTTWQQILKDAVTDLPSLLKQLDLNVTDMYLKQARDNPFPLRVPAGFISRMEKGNLNDPLLLQVLPQPQELDVHPGYSHDPVGDQSANPIPGLLHKYHGRVLLTLTAACAINCRYCFRRHFPYEENMMGMKGRQRVLDYINNDKTIDEVILSGSDPLLAKDTELVNLVAQLESISHIKRLRIHTRLPIVIPERITDTLLECLQASRFDTIIIVHCNHPNEIDEAVADALNRCRDNNITVLNQMVLLKGVNDTVDDLVSLNKKLFSLGVLPYYLNLLDKVQGSAHFDIDDQHAISLHNTLREKLPGYLVPRLVREKAGEPYKLPVF